MSGRDVRSLREQLDEAEIIEIVTDEVDHGDGITKFLNSDATRKLL